MVGAVEQIALEDLGVAGHETGAQARQVGALGQAVEHHAALEVAAPQRDAGTEQAGRRAVLVEVEFAVALVRGDHEVVFIGQGNQPLQGFQRQQGAGGVAWRADEQDLRALPDLGRHGIEIRCEAVVGQAWQVVRGGAGQQGRAFVDLIEGIGTDHQPALLAVEHRLHEGEQRLAGAADGQRVAPGVQPAVRYAEALLAPGDDGFAQGGRTQRGRIDRQLVHVRGQRLGDKSRRGMLGLADGQGDVRPVGRRLRTGHQGAQLLEGVGVEQGQGWIHGCVRC